MHSLYKVYCQYDKWITWKGETKRVVEVVLYVICPVCWHVYPGAWRGVTHADVTGNECWCEHCPPTRAVNEPSRSFKVPREGPFVNALVGAFSGHCTLHFTKFRWQLYCPHCRLVTSLTSLRRKLLSGHCSLVTTTHRRR